MAKPPYTTGFRRVPRRHRKVLKVLLTGARNLNGYVICRWAGVGTGTVYPLLSALEKCGWANATWEEGAGFGGTWTRFWTLTPEGRERVAALLEGRDGDG